MEGIDRRHGGAAVDGGADVIDPADIACRLAAAERERKHRQPFTGQLPGLDVETAYTAQWIGIQARIMTRRSRRDLGIMTWGGMDARRDDVPHSQGRDEQSASPIGAAVPQRTRKSPLRAGRGASNAIRSASTRLVEMR